MLKILSEKWPGISRVPLQKKRELINDICFVNLNRVKIFSIVLTVLFLLLVGVDLLNRQRGLWDNPGYRGLFYVHSTVLIGVFVSFIISLFIAPKSVQGVAIGHKVFVLALALMIMVAGAITSAVDQLIHGQISGYILTVFALGVILFFGLMEGIFVYGATLAVFIVVITYVQKDPNQLFGHYVNGSVLTVIAWVFSRVIYTARAREFLQRDTIDQQKKRLAEQVGINRELMQSLIDVSTELDNSSNKMSAGSESFSQNIQNQAASIEEMTATIEDVTARSESVSSVVYNQSSSMTGLMNKMDELQKITREMEEKILAALKRTLLITDQAKSGGQFISEMDKSMGEISSTSREMTNILNIINDISDKINLLSLNASIEAARAGDAGRGFAVVADEIGKLADQTSSSVKDIDSLLKKSETEVGKGLVSVKDTVSTIGDIINGVNEINMMINAIGDHMKTYIGFNNEVNRETEIAINRFKEIKDSTDEQKKAAVEIVGAISDINRISQSNATKAEEILSLSRIIATMAHDLRDKIALYSEDA